MTLRIVLVDDHELIRHGLRRAFERTGDFEVVAEAGSVKEGVATIRHQRRLARTLSAHAPPALTAALGFERAP